MPGGDRTGPAGYGPRTGRGLGYCSGYNSPGFTRGAPRGGGGFGRGWGRGFWGRGRGYWYNQYPDEPYYRPSYEPRPSADEEKQYLKDTIANLEKDLDAMKKRLQDIESNK